MHLFSKLFNVFRDKLFPVYGFGARLPPNGIVSHDFAVVSQTDYIEKPSENTVM